ncbi:chemotaxis protein CheA [Marinagarivorans algicola]|uniref:chemotaxis protein CheA n=1 Tax=Marinagarivorans algicola TaxID=1513270 RepID=UPI0006B9CE52|nr:chemotaxis protein CheA [Marinagarivorans algicola]
MSFGEDEEILQDFLVEAGEILDQLSEQLVELEQRPDDRDLLNAIFRGFHTVKGGAGFLQLNNMVTCCHVTENLFDILRNGKRPVTSELMDVVLQALDTVNSQFEDVQQRRPALDPPAELVTRLERLVSCEDLNDNVEELASLPPESSSQVVNDHLDLSDDQYEGYMDAISDKEEASDSTHVPESSSSNEISEEEFDDLLDQLHGKGSGPGVESSSHTAEDSTPSAPKASNAASDHSSDEISEDEFEALLDQLHGSGKSPSAAEKSADPVVNAAAAQGGDLITDSEFEDLLDQLHGAGKGPAIASPSHDSNSSIASAPSSVIPITQAPKAATSSGMKKVPAAAGVTNAKASDSGTHIAAIGSAKPTVSPAPARETASGGASVNAAPAAEATVRVDTQRLDDIMNMVGELVLVRNRLVRLGLDANDESLSKAVSNLDVVTADLQTAVMKTRMQPIKKVFGRFPRVVRDLARNLKKEIVLELVGEETDLDKNLVEALADPLVHLVRNSVDHGIELPSVREEKGKSRLGKVILAAEQEGDHILLSITDDGGGMDPNKLREKAVEKGILDADAAARLSDIEAFSLIFAPGFSTKTEISDVSGRGVGMDVVKTKITQLNGSIDIDSKLGEGTRIAIKVPLTLAIMPTLMIMLGRQTFALPLVSVNEIFHMDLRKTNVVDGQECVTIREKAIPIFHLKRWLVRGPVSADKPEEGHVVIVNVGTRRVGFIVDQLIGQEEVVIKPLGKMLQGTPGMAGATITGDGTIALILDVPSMLNKYVGVM